MKAFLSIFLLLLLSSHQPHPSVAAQEEATSTANAAVTTVGPFQLRLHWTPRSCWQGDCRTELDWCLQCEGLRCNVGDILWIEPCRQDLPDQQLFRWIIVGAELHNGGPTEWGQLEVRDLEQRDGQVIASVFCVERIRRDHYELRECDATLSRQWFRGIDEIEPFELYPPPLEGGDRSITIGIDTPQDSVQNVTGVATNQVNSPTIDNTNCINMHHHPRHYEEMIHTTCQRARQVHTNLWQTVMKTPPSIAAYQFATIESAQEFPAEEFNAPAYYTLGRPRGDPRCKPSSTCGMCQGHCRSDRDCAGSLRCFERSSQNPIQAPPGCYGQGVPRIDYCYAPGGN